MYYKLIKYKLKLALFKKKFMLKKVIKPENLYINIFKVVDFKSDSKIKKFLIADPT